MIDLISEVIDKFGPRPAGSEAEKKAQLFIEQKAREITNKVSFLPFDEYLDARFGKLKYYTAVYVGALLLYFQFPAVSFIISLLSSFFIVFDLMMYRDILTNFPGKKQTSSNVEAVLEPQGEVKSTLVFSGHIDSTREYTWWYKLGAAGITLTIIAGVLMVLQPFFFLWHVLQPQPFQFYIWLAFAILSPVTIVYWSMHGDEAVPGAQDNLSGITIALSVFKTLADSNNKGKTTLNHTRIKFVSFGSEERGLCGSRAYVQQKKDELKNENAHLVNIDGVRLVKEVAIVKNELMNGTTHTPELVTGLENTFKQLNYPCKKVTIPIGGTDGVSFARAGLPSVTIIGMSASEYDFTYHTRNDLVEHIEPQSLENVRNTLVEFARNWDKKQ
jgi:acetylornithine deacetylase/succinyl-diaminopimelate desuccinylase-like protein